MTATPMGSTTALAWRFAWRELRGGLAGFRVLLACLALGVFAIAGAGSTREAVNDALARDAQLLLGGDLELRLIYREAEPEQDAALRDYGTLSHMRDTRAMVRAGETRALSEVKAVDGAYPLYGAVTLDPPLPLAEALGRQDSGLWGVALEPSLALRLGVTPGETVQIGEATLEITALVLKEPDRVASALSFGPRSLMAQEALVETELMQPGSLISNHYRLRLADPRTAARVAEEITQRFPDAGWRIRMVDQAASGLERFLDNVTLFLTLVGLTALLVGGIGVANAVKAHVDSRISTIATLKCLGAPAGLVFRVYLLQITVLAVLGIAAGLVLGALTPMVFGGLLSGLLPVELSASLYPRILLEAAVFGLLITLVFGLGPLARTRDIPAAALFRSLIVPASGRLRGPVLAVIVLAAVALCLLTIVTAEKPFLAVWFLVGATASLALFRGVAWVVLAGATRYSPALSGAGRPGLRLALANLHRPGAPTPSVILSLGLGLTVLVIIALIEGNLNHQIGERLPEEAPAFYFIDIQQHQVDSFTQAVQSVPEARLLSTSDMVRGRIVALKGQPVDVNAVAEEVRWAVQGDRALSMARTLPADAIITAGAWWPEDYSGPPLLSVAASLAQGLGVGPGDTVTLNVLGREITGTVASLREVDWSTLSMNFAFLVSPGTLEGAPRTWIATVAAPPSAEEAVERAVTNAHSNITAIRVREALLAFQGILESAGMAVRATAAVTLVAGFLVLAGAIAASHRRRVAEAVVLKVLGATRGTVLRSYLLEYGLMGAAIALFAAGIGSLASWAVLTFVMRADWIMMPGVVALTLLGCILLTLAGGFLGTWRALSAKPAPLLRND